MIIQLATHLGMCFGVRDALKLAHEKADNERITILGDLVHNQGILSELSDKGIVSKQTPDEARTKSVVITAHGTSNRMRKQLSQSGFTVHDATCPLVHHAHRELEKLVAQDCFPIIIGVEGHIEVRGLTGDLDDYRVVLSEQDLTNIPNKKRFGVVAQTTQPIGTVRHLVMQIEKKFPHSEVIFRDTVCQPTKNRQRAAIELSSVSDIVIVIGGKNSNNTHELVRVCATKCQRVHHIQSEKELRHDWFSSTDHIGVTAGTSTPRDQIQAVVRTLENWATSTTISSSDVDLLHQPTSLGYD